MTCLPELGGRIHSVFDKTRGAEMFHINEEIKPALIAMRGAWISGGIEWNWGPHGHTVTIVSPVDALVEENADGSATLVVGNTEKMFQTRWTARVTPAQKPLGSATITFMTCPQAVGKNKVLFRIVVGGGSAFLFDVCRQSLRRPCLP